MHDTTTALFRLSREETRRIRAYGLDYHDGESIGAVPDERYVTARVKVMKP